MGTTNSKNRNKDISRSRAALLKAGAPLVGRGLDVAIFQDRRKLAILQNAIDTIDLTNQESSAVESLGRKLGGCGKEGLGLDYYYTSSCVDAFTSPPTSNSESRHTPDPRIKVDRLTNKLKLEAKMCRSFACARCAYSATSKTYAKLGPVQNLLIHEKTEWKVALLTLQGKQNGRMSISERLAAAEAAFSSWRKALDAARRYVARRRQGAAYGAVSLFETQVVDLNAKPWIKPHFHVLIVCENQAMFNQLMGRLETFLDPAERRILGDTTSDIKKVISYFCKENYAGHQRGQNRGHSESIHETSNQAAIVELAMLVRLRRARQTMRISGILGDAKVILHKKGLQSSTEKDREWLDMGSAPHGHLNVLLMMLDGESKAKELINSMPTSVQDKSIAVESRKKKSSKLNRLKRKKSAAERRLKRSGYKDKNAELWVETIAEEIAKLELQPAVSVGEDCLSTKVEKESQPPKTVEPNVPSPLPLRVKCRKENKKRR